MKLIKINDGYINADKIIQIYERPINPNNSDSALVTVIEIEGFGTGNTGPYGELPYYYQNEEEVKNIISQIHEPQKVVVPKFVADFYESIKDDFEHKVYDLCLQFSRDNGELSSEVWRWFDREKNEPIQTLVKMKLYGYTVETEKLYTVAIAGICYYKLFKNTRTNEYRFYCEKEVEGFTDKLTEQEIKKAGERLWQFAREVE